MDKTVEDAMAGPADAVVVEETGLGRYQVAARAGTSTFLVDEPVDVGGLGSGPDPYDLLAAALGACTAMTLRLYADRKGWPLARVRVHVAHCRSIGDAREGFARQIVLEGQLDEAQRKRLAEIAERCPVHRTLERGADIKTTLAQPASAVDLTPASSGQHMAGMTEACA